MKDSTSAKFFLFTFLLSWCAWGLLAWLAPSGVAPSSPTYLLFMLGGFGPTLLGVILTTIHEGRKGLGYLWRRTVQFRFGFQWYVIIFLLFPAISAITLMVKDVASGLPPHFSLVLGLSTSPNLIFPSLISFFIFGALAEEFGWRGYALDRLQARLGRVFGSLSLGVLWAIWHLPLFYIAGLPQHESGLSFPLFAVWIVALSPIYTWIYNGTGRSMGAVLLLHWVSTTTASLLPTAQGETIGLVILSVLILLSWRKRSTLEKVHVDSKKEIGESYEQSIH